jgi:hypothetical protein
MRTLLYTLIFTTLIGCQNSELKNDSSTNENVWIDLNQIQQGPIVRDSLTPKQLEQIEYLYNTFHEVDATSKEKWIEDFKRDQNPDREIEIWMMMANAYTNYCLKAEFDLNIKKEVYQVVLLRSSVTEEEVLKHLNLVHLTNEDASEIMQYYTLKAKPIRVIEK